MADKDLEFWDDGAWQTFIKGWSDELKQYFGSRLRTAQQGKMAERGVKRLSDFDIVLFEIKHPGGARVVYTNHYATLTDCIHVLDAFMKDSREGRKMRTSDKTRIKARLSQIKERMKPLEQEARLRKKLH